MKLTVTAKVEEEVVSEAERLAGVFNVTRSQLVAWAVERSVVDLRVRVAELQANGTSLDGLPGIPRGILS